ncbi:beta-lactamase family protein [Methanoculleus sp. FWC-SCC1]|uniref:Beta-lactamase family protein n=1 Tax=Methanoculleus frigidifontis TaxID=2584085 RepID=A0ABT8M720_9EURY|nr:serine hydrolase domain-containing protein [Methanoculleus sp. FWC-SCC1]MDN7023728.1 beta-lactamase family protein [Methanoculleus sp. FWC-SCC1]
MVRSLRTTAAVLLVLLVLLICALAAPAAASASTDGPSDPAEVEAFFDATVPANLAKYNVPGSAVAVVKDGNLVLTKGYGFSNIENATPVDADRTLFHIGSITKLFTWTAVMQLASEGRIDLDTNVNGYLTDITIPDTYPGQPVTLRHLMTHTAGFEDSERHFAAASLNEVVSFRDYCRENIPARVRPPGTVSSYSNYGTTLAAVVVEDVTGIPFEEYLASRILDPLGMNRTSIAADLPPELAADLAQGYAYAGPQNEPIPDTIFVIGPAGMITSSAPDMARFLTAHMDGGTYRNATILSPAAAREMHARTFANDPRVAGMCLGFYENFINGRRIIVHGGDTNTFHSLLAIIPEQRAGFFVSYNSAGGGEAREELLAAFMNHYYPAEPSSVSEPDPSAAARLQAYAGTYASNRRNYATFEMFLAPPEEIAVTVSPDGTLLLNRGGRTLEFAEVEQGVFTKTAGGSPAVHEIVFHQAADGTADYFCIQNVPIMVFERVPWYATVGFLNALKTAAGIVLATVLLWPLLAAFRRSYAITEPPVPVPARIARWVAGAAALVLLLFAFVLVPWIRAQGALITAYLYEPAAPSPLAGALTLPVVATVMTVASVVFAALAWKERYWTVPERVHYAIVTVALLALLWWASAWNLWIFCL